MILRTQSAAIIGVGAFLGVSQKDVVVPFSELKVTTRDGKDRLVLNRTKDELKLADAMLDNTALKDLLGKKW